MKITPLEIRQHEFEKTFRGYNIEEVDSFLGTLSQEWERVLNESKMLRMQLEIAEKEANKLREIEMTLFKTLKTAEDTSTMITEQASQQADKHIQESKLQGEKVLIEAQQKANNIIKQAESRAKYIKEEVLGDVKVLERDFRAMDHYKTNLLVQMRSLSNATLEHVLRFEDKFDKEGVDAKFKEATSMLTEEEENIISVEKKGVTSGVTSVVEETIFEEVIENPLPVFENTIVNEIPSISPELLEETESEEIEEQPVEMLVEETIGESAILEETNIESRFVSSTENEAIEQESAERQFVKSLNEVPKADELEQIEGVGPKIAMLLYDAGIFTFRDLAITPVYKIEEILQAAGSQFASHDPSTWTQQAKLAAEGRWEDLKALKFYLVGGREPKIVEELTQTPIEVLEVETQESVEIISQVEDEIQSDVTTSFFKEVENHIENVEETVLPIDQPIIENNLDSITEEMLEKVNKVKAAIRKAMVEKNDAPSKDNTPIPTLNDVISKSNETTPKGNSFFDNI